MTTVQSMTGVSTMQLVLILCNSRQARLRTSDAGFNEHMGESTHPCCAVLLHTQRLVISWGAKQGEQQGA